MVGVFGFSLIILTKAKEDIKKKGFLVLGLSGMVTRWEDKIKIKKGNELLWEY